METLILVGVLGFISLIGLILRAFRPGGWKVSSGGNPTMILKGSRITVFERDGGWKFCIADAHDDRRQPYFSEVYRTQDAAKQEALALAAGRTPTHRTRAEESRIRRKGSRQEFLADLTEFSQAVAELVPQALAGGKLTALRPLEAKLRTKARHALSLADDMYVEGDDETHIEQLRHLRETWLAAANALAIKIAEVEASRKSRKPA